MAGGKRRAISDLNHNNWDAEDEPEEAGSFVKAAEDKLKNRVIKVAKRRSPIGSVATSTPVVEPEKKGAFVNFGGFTKIPTVTTASSFSFLGNVTSSVEHPTTNGLGIANSASSSSALLDNTVSDRHTEFYAKIKGLNQSVSNWIKKHVDTNPLLDLTPIFRDYEKHLKEIECLNNVLVATKMTEENKTTEAKTMTTPKFDDSNRTFGNLNSIEIPTFSFGKTSTLATNIGFSFGSSSSLKPFTIVEKPVADEDNYTESDEPPKVEFMPVVEEGHIYSIRCKVFVKKGDTYGDRGVGTLYLKPVLNSDKVQLIVRADTSLGLLLCNVLLSSNIPMQRMGKKDVMLVCIPLPENKPPPVPVLLRVKSSEDADELLKTLDKHKK